MPELNFVSTSATDDPTGAAGQVTQPYYQVSVPGYNYGSANNPAGDGFMEYGSGTPGSLPFKVDQDGNVTANSVTPAVPAVVSGQFLRAPAQYAPASQVGIATLSATLASMSAAPTTVASGSNGGEISAVASWSSPSNGTLDVASTAGWPTAGTITVATSTTPATVTYTGITATALTGCAYVSGSATGTVATGGAVALAKAGAGAAAVPAISTGSFTAPASGSVLVTAWLVSQVSTSADGIAFALCAHGTLTPVVGSVIAMKDPNSTQPYPHALEFLVTGLTPGTAYNFDLMFAVGSAGTLTVFANTQTSTTPNVGNTGVGAPIVMTVQAV